MGRPHLFEEPADRVEIRVPEKLRARAQGHNFSKLVATSLEHFLEHPTVSQVIQDRDAYRSSMEALAQEIRTLRQQRKQVVKIRQDHADLKRSITMTLRQAVGPERARSMKLYRRCADAVAQMDELARQIDPEIARLQGGGAA